MYGHIQYFLSLGQLHVALVTPLIPHILSGDPPLWNSFIIPVKGGADLRVVPLSEISHKLVYLKIDTCACVQATKQL